ncbi:Armadillo repeat-containing protein 4 [Nymphon striatum]|nr:Armadillo repeat-containing protein 4 [Nymphon striatum]
MLVEELLRPIFDNNELETMSGLQQVLDDVASHSRTGRLWVDCLIKPIFTILKYIRAEREADWALHLDTVEEMIPLFFSAGHVHYTRYALYYLRFMQDLPADIQRKFVKGHHTMHHSTGLFNGIWSDMAIETTFMRYGHSKSGIVGITLKLKTLKTWAYSLHTCHGILDDLDMTTTQEESDTLIIQQVAHVTDSTVLVCKGRAVLDINAAVEVQKLIIPDLLAAHGLTGCDTVASCYRIGKGVALKVLRSNKHKLNYLGNTDVDLTDVVEQATHIMIACYGQSGCSSFTEARTKLWSRKNTGHHRMLSVDEKNSDSSCEEDDTENGGQLKHQKDKRNLSAKDLPASFWEIQKLVKYIKIGSLRVLSAISENKDVQKEMCNKNKIKVIMDILNAEEEEAKILVVNVLANIATISLVRETVWELGGVKILQENLNVERGKGKLIKPKGQGPNYASRMVLLALKNLSKSSDIQKQMQKVDGVSILLDLLTSEKDDSLLILIVETLENCTHQCAVNAELQNIIRTNGGLDQLVVLLNKHHRDNQPLMVAVTKALWKCSVNNHQSIRKIQDLKAIELLVTLIHDQPEKVMTCAAGALAECSRLVSICSTIRKAGGIEYLTNLLSTKHIKLLLNVIRTLGFCMAEKECLKVIEKLDGVRIIWSLLKNEDKDVQKNAIDAVTIFVNNKQDSADAVRNFVGGLELVVNLLKSDSEQVQTSVCYAIAAIAQDRDNVTVMTDHNVVPSLSSIIVTKDPELQKAVTTAIAKCCLPENRSSFGDNNTVTSNLATSLQSSDEGLRNVSVEALSKLSYHPPNCIRLLKLHVVPHLIKMIESHTDQVQENAANCLRNLRKLVQMMNGK